MSSSDDESYSERLSSDRINKQVSGTGDDDDDDDVVSGVRNGRIMITKSESEGESDGRKCCDRPGWTPCDQSMKLPPRINFISGERATGPWVSSKVVEPLHFFKLFFTEELADKVVADTNRYASTKLQGKLLSPRSIWRTWHNVTKAEFWAFIGAVVNMGTVTTANMKEYWSKDPTTTIPFFPNTFSRNRFAQIFWMLHAETVTEQHGNNETLLRPITGYLHYINSKLLDYFTPGKEICVDESVVKFKGRISFIKYNPKKPRKWGIRIHTLADSGTGYICGFLANHGSLATETLIRPDLPLSTRIPLHLYSMLLDRVPGAQGHHMFTDRYYTTFILADELIKLKCHLTGIISPNRKGLPEGIKKRQLAKGKSIAYRRQDRAIANVVLAWKDKRILRLLTNFHNAAMDDEQRTLGHGTRSVVRKPDAVANYIKYTGGVKIADHHASTYCFIRKSKWWRKLFFWGLDICLINSYILYKAVKKQRKEEPVNHLRFRKMLVKQLKGDFRELRRASTSTSNADGIRLDGKLHVMLSGTKRDCKVCSRRNPPGKRHETSHYCDTCPDKPRIHLGQCFINYHTKVKYRD